MYVDLKYKLDEAGIKIMAGCATNHIISEVKDAVSEAFREIVVTIDHCEDTGIVKLIAVNNRSICQCD